MIACNSTFQTISRATLKISLMSKQSAGGYTQAEDHVSGRSPELTDPLLQDEKGLFPTVLFILKIDFFHVLQFC